MSEIIDFIRLIAARASLQRIRLQLDDGYQPYQTDLSSHPDYQFIIDRSRCADGDESAELYVGNDSCNRRRRLFRL